LKTLPRNSFISIITYSNVVSLYQLNSNHCISAKVIPGKLKSKDHYKLSII